MTNLRRTLALVASLTIGGLLVSATPLSASARTVDERCLGDGPIAASSLGRGATAPRCSLVGRVVSDGHVFVVVPPPGMSVSGEGVGRTDPPAPEAAVETSPVSRSYRSISNKSVFESWAYSKMGPGVTLRV